jgi:hypothetical protein
MLSRPRDFKRLPKLLEFNLPLWHSPHTNILYEKGTTRRQHADDWVFKQLYSDPCPCCRYTHTCNNGCCLQPVLRSEAMLPIQPRSLFHLVCRPTYFAVQRIRTCRTLHRLIEDKDYIIIRREREQNSSLSCFINTS